MTTTRERLRALADQQWGRDDACNIAIAACEQSGRNRVPAVAPILDLPQYLGIAVQENALRFVCAPGVAVRLRDLAAPEGPVSLLVGPEGGFEDGEPNEDLAAVITTASARLAANPTGLQSKRIDDVEYRYSLASSFSWTLAEQAVLNRYRVTAM